MAFIYGVHLKDDLLVYIGLSKLYGIGNHLAIDICKKLLIPHKVRFSQLNSFQLSIINQYVSSILIESETKRRKKVFNKSNG
jgi:ribosomal protein S13